MIRFTKLLSGTATSTLKLVTVLSVLHSTTNHTYAMDNYQPELSGLTTKASRSTELYVDPEFNFSTSKKFTIDLSIESLEGQSVANKLILVSSVSNNPDIDLKKRIANKSIIGIVKTDENGQVYSELEISNLTNLIYIQLKEQTAQNSALVRLDESLYISHVFSSQ